MDTAINIKDEDGNGSWANEITLIFVLGGPGSGKSTQCPIIEEQFGFVHISAGDVLRAELQSGSEASTMIQKIMEKGELVPSDFMTRLLQRAMQASGGKKFLVDGFPRSLENLLTFEDLMSIEPEFVMYFDCSEEVMQKRLLKRNQGRNDDNIDTIRKRLEGLKSMFPVIDYYSSKGKLYKINGEKSVEEVSKDINSIFHNWMKAKKVESKILPFQKEHHMIMFSCRMRIQYIINFFIVRSWLGFPELYHFQCTG